MIWRVSFLGLQFLSGLVYPWANSVKLSLTNPRLLGHTTLPRLCGPPDNIVFALKIFPFAVFRWVCNTERLNGCYTRPKQIADLQMVSDWVQVSKQIFLHQFRHPRFFLWPESQPCAYLVTRYGETVGIKAAEQSDPERRAICSQVWFSLVVKRLSRGLQSCRLRLGVACLVHVTTSTQQLKLLNDISWSGQRNPLP